MNQNTMDEHAISLGRIEKWINESEMQIGDLFPSEKKLSEDLDISLSELRKVMAFLEMNGVVDRKPGGHGIYLVVKQSENVPVQNSRDFQLLTEQVSPEDASMARLVLEPELCRMAAVHATSRQIARIHALNDQIKKSRSWEEYDKLDANFHALIAKSSNNALLFEMYRIVNAVRIAVVSKKRRDSLPDGPPEDFHSFLEHDIIISALESRDRNKAQAAMRTHLKSIMSDLVLDH